MTALRWYPPSPARQPFTVVISPRQADVLTGLCHGHTNAEIGRRLFITEHTVKSNCKRLFAALQARDRCHAVALVATGQVDVIVRDGRERPEEGAA